MKPGCKRATAVLLVLSMLFSLSACKKTKKTVSAVVSEDDPYFDVQEIGLNYNLVSEEDKCNVFGAVFIGENVVTRYIVQGEKNDKIYVKSGITIFDMNGTQLGMIEVPDNKEVENYFSGPNNEIMILTCESFWDESGDMSFNSYELNMYAPSGELIMNVPLAIPFLEDTFLLAFAFLEDGTMLVNANDIIYCQTSEGEFLWAMGNEKEGLNYTEPNFIHIGKDWYLRTTEITEDYNISRSYIQKIDLESHVLEDKQIQLKAPDVSLYSFDDGSNYYFTNMTGLYREDMLNGKREEIIAWNSIDYNYLQFYNYNFRVVSSDELYTTVIEQTPVEDSDTDVVNVGMKLIHMTRAPRNPHAGKALITLGLVDSDIVSFLDYLVRYNTMEGGLARIAIFVYDDMDIVNKSTDPFKQRKELVDYVYKEMCSGKGPDILMGFSEYSQFNADKILCDLTPFMDGENGLKREDYFDNIFRAFEVKGKMYQIPVCVDFAGYVANGDMIGERTGWTCTEFNQVVSNLPEGVQVFPETPCLEILQMILANSMDSFVDYEKNEVFFDGEEFKLVLETAKKYGIEVPEGEFLVTGDQDDPTNPELFEDGKIAMFETYIYNLTSFEMNKQMCNRKAIFVGYPSMDGSGMTARPQLTFGISSTSNYKNEAWDFIRFMFTYEEQLTYSSYYACIPLSRSAFHQYCTDEIKRNEEREEMYKEFGEEDLAWMGQIIHLSSENETEFSKLAENISTRYSVDEDITDMIYSQAIIFFDGVQSIEETVTNIQNKATIIMQSRI